MRGFRIGGVVAMCRRLELLAATSTLSPERSEQVRRRAAEVVLQVEALCSRHAHPTHLLPRPTLLALRRLRVLAALGLPSTSTEPPPAAKPEPPPAPRSAPPMRSIAPLESTLRLRGTLAVLKGLFERLSRPEELDAGLSRTRGRVFDLEAMFEEVNGRYFKGAIARPTLSWAPVVSTRVMGRYFPHQDRVELSPLLDDERLEADTVAFVLYHELLHKHHGAEHRKGRRHVHTRAFRRDEAAYAEAPLHDARLNEFFAAVSAARLLS